MPRGDNNKGAWSDESKVEQLKMLWKAGLSCSQIAAEIGNVTRNAVIGKVHRLGLSGRAKAPISAAPRRRKARPAQQMMVVRPKNRVEVALELVGGTDYVSPSSVFDTGVPMAQRLSLFQLEAATCHWPIGEPGSSEFFFCGGKALVSLPYCAHHSRVAYQPASDRRRQPPKPSR